MDWSRCRWGEGSVTCGRASRGISDPDYYVFNMATRLPQAAQPPHAPRNTPRASATTTALHPADQHPRPRVSNYLPAAGGHRPPSTASSRAAATYGARAGRRHSPTGSWAFYPVNLHLPPLGRVSPWTSVPNASAELGSALRNCSSAPHKPVNRAAERSGVAGWWAHGRQPATHCTVKWLSQRAPLHPQASRV